MGASCPCAVAGPRKRSAQVRGVSQAPLGQESGQAGKRRLCPARRHLWLAVCSQFLSQVDTKAAGLGQAGPSLEKGLSSPFTEEETGSVGLRGLPQ